ncbi:MAG: flavin reductase [Thermoplasmatota archaeon]
MAFHTLNDVTYGLYLISTADGGKLNGLIVNTVVQVTSRPEKISVTISNQNYTHDMIRKSGFFSISILSKDTPMKFIGSFGFKSGRDIDKFGGIDYFIGKSGAPIVTDHSIGYLDIVVTQSLDVGSHTIFIGKIVDSRRLTDDEPMTYHYYKNVKGGKASRNAPTFDNWNLLSRLEGNKEKGELVKVRHRCKSCHYIYDPMTGDSDSGIQRGTIFDELPDEWICPLCGSGKEFFLKLEE